jgi:hypothetical protein
LVVLLKEIHQNASIHEGKMQNMNKIVFQPYNEYFVKNAPLLGSE